MASYLERFKDKYRLAAPIDLRTNDFCRDKNGNLCGYNDIYIKCAGGIMIYHYGKDVLEAYIPSINKGRNILKAIGEELIGNVEQYMVTTETNAGKSYVRYNYDALYNDLIKTNRLVSITETDAEVFFKFKVKELDLVAKYTKPSTKGCGKSPFASSNLPKTKYEISAEEMSPYKEIIASIPKEELLSISRITKNFLTQFEKTSQRKNKSFNVKADMKLHGLKGKEYIHWLGKWDEYLDYLRSEINL